MSSSKDFIQDCLPGFKHGQPGGLLDPSQTMIGGKAATTGKGSGIFASSAAKGGTFGGSKGGLLGSSGGFLGNTKGGLIGSTKGGLIGSSKGGLLGSGGGFLGNTKGGLIGSSKGGLLGSSGGFLGNTKGGLIGSSKGGLLSTTTNGGMLSGATLLPFSAIQHQVLVKSVAATPLFTGMASPSAIVVAAKKAAMLSKSSGTKASILGSSKAGGLLGGKTLAPLSTVTYGSVAKSGVVKSLFTGMPPSASQLLHGGKAKVGLMNGVSLAPLAALKKAIIAKSFAAKAFFTGTTFGQGTVIGTGLLGPVLLSGIAAAGFIAMANRRIPQIKASKPKPKPKPRDNNVVVKTGRNYVVNPQKPAAQQPATEPPIKNLAAVQPVVTQPTATQTTPVKPQKVKPKEVKPKEVKPQEVKPQEVKPQEVKPAMVKPIMAVPKDAKPSVTQSAKVNTPVVKPDKVNTPVVKPEDNKTAVISVDHKLVAPDVKPEQSQSDTVQANEALTASHQSDVGHASTPTPKMFVAKSETIESRQQKPGVAASATTLACNIGQPKAVIKSNLSSAPIVEKPSPPRPNVTPTKVTSSPNLSDGGRPADQIQQLMAKTKALLNHRYRFQVFECERHFFRRIVIPAGDMVVHWKNRENVACQGNVISATMHGIKFLIPDTDCEQIDRLEYQGGNIILGISNAVIHHCDENSGMAIFVEFGNDVENWMTWINLLTRIDEEAASQ